MAQVFKPRSNAIFRLVLLGTALSISIGGLFAEAYKWSPYTTDTEVPFEQPVPFSHKHHVSGLGIDCRYCHTSVEKSSTAGMPPIHTCMTCHSQIWNQSPMLAPIREAYASGKAIHWRRVYHLPDYVYFDHSIHVHKGVGCTTCHGDIGQMPLTWKAKPFYMRDCLECHRAPERYLRPREEVFNPDYQAPDGPEQLRLGTRLAQEYGIPPHAAENRLTSCNTCHR